VLDWRLGGCGMGGTSGSCDQSASKGRMSVLMAKESVNASQELSLQEGLRFERRLFHSLFATADQKEGMNAFLEKRPPNFTHK
jgi:enoyl-CoA hydratase/carnithine racemase